jgi:CubicO group peptidase (beta-lactamase class C family)
MSDITRRQFALRSGAALFALPALGFGQKPGKREPAWYLSDEFLEKLPGLMDWAAVPGVAITIVRDGKLAWSKGFGVKKVGEKDTVDSSTLFGAASLSKPVFAYAVMRMRDEKLIDLDRPLWNYLPNADLPDTENSKLLTARHVLSHSSGLQNWRFNRDQKLEFAFKPGESFRYSGEGFFYLQRVAEQITGRGFEEFMQERVLKPLGMVTSTYLWKPENESLVAWGHDQRLSPSPMFNATQGKLMLAVAADWKKPVESWKYEDVVKAQALINKDRPALPNFLLPNTAGSLITSVDEYAKFMTRLMDRESRDSLDISEAGHKEMLSTQTKINSGISWGLGVGLEEAASRRLFWHWGDNGTYKDFMMGDPVTRSGIVVFTNGSNGQRLWRTIVAEATGTDHAAFYFWMT